VYADYGDMCTPIMVTSVQFLFGSKLASHGAKVLDWEHDVVAGAVEIQREMTCIPLGRDLRTGTDMPAMSLLNHTHVTSYGGVSHGGPAPASTDCYPSTPPMAVYICSLTILLGSARL